MRILFTKDGNQHVCSGDFLLAAASGLHVHDGALNDPLEPQGGLGVDIVGACYLGGVVFDEIRQ